MTPFFPISSSFVEKEEEENHQNLKLYIFSSTFQPSSSHLSYDQSGNHIPHHHKDEKSLVSAIVSSGNNEAKESFDRLGDDHQELEDDHRKTEKGNGLSAKNWMSSKMRLMQKMMINTNKKYNNTRITQNQRYGRWETRSCSSNHNNGVVTVRVCSDCNTTTTPLWRSGPQGPKSLCNACGIRQRKARRAIAEAANGGSIVATTADASTGKRSKEKKSRIDDIVTGHEKNKCSKVIDNSSDNSQSEGNVSFEKITVSLSKRNSAFGRVFPRDEEEGAILLMELSCGLVHSC